MDAGRPLIISGLLAAGFGVLFYLQGVSVVGPESSFMYSSPEWMSYGPAIAATGLAVACVGVVLALRRTYL